MADVLKKYAIINLSTIDEYFSENVFYNSYCDNFINKCFIIKLTKAIDIEIIKERRIITKKLSSSSYY